MSLRDATGESRALVGTPRVFPESGSCLQDMDMPWGWILENLLDVKKLPLSFYKDIIRYVLHIEQPQCSRLLQKVALRYLDEVTVTRKLDTCDVLLLRFILKEQGVSNLRRIHSLKESFENDLILRVETEAVLANLKCSSKEGGIDWAAFEDVGDSVFSEDIFEPRGVERRKELTAVLPEESFDILAYLFDRNCDCHPIRVGTHRQVWPERVTIFLASYSGRLQDRSNGDPKKHLCEQLLEKYPLDELCRDLTRFVYDKRKFFKIKFLDQLAKDVENGVYSFSPGSDSPDTWTPSKPRTDFCDHCPAEDDLHCATGLPGSMPAPCQKEKRRATDKDGDSDLRNRVAGPNVSEPKDVRTEMSFRMAEVDKVADGITNEIHELVNEITKFTEGVHNTASIPFSTPDLRNQQISYLSAPIAGNSVSIQQNSIVMCPAKRAERDLGIDKLMEHQSENRKSLHYHQIVSLGKCRERHILSKQTFASVVETSRISPEKFTKRHGVEIVDQHTGVAKRRKVDGEEELSEEQRNQSGASGENTGFSFRPAVEKTFGEVPGKDRLSTENVINAAMRVSENCEYDLPAAGGGDDALNAKCYFCGSSGGCQAFCHRCSVPVHEACLSELCMSHLKVENCCHCFDCAAILAQEGLRKAQEDMKEAIEALRNAEEEVLATQERLATFFSARKERLREHPTGKNDIVEFNLCGKVTETNNERIQSMHVEQGSTEDFRSYPGEEERTILPQSGTITATRVSLSGSTVQNVTKYDTIRHICPTRQEIEMQTAPQASVLSEGLQAARSCHVPDPDLPRERIDGQAFTSVPSLPVSQGPAPEDKDTFGCCGKVQSGGPRSAPDRVPPMILNATDNDTKSGPYDVLNINIGATNVVTNGSGISRSHGGDSGPPSDPLFNTRNLAGEEGDGHDGDLEEVCEENSAAAERTNAADQAVERISEASNVGAKARHCQVYRGRNQIPGIRRRHLPWTEIEEDVLKEGVNMFSNGGEWGFHWRRILDFGVGKFHESRTAVDLKDKWRNILRGRSISSDRSS